MRPLFVAALLELVACNGCGPCGPFTGLCQPNPQYPDASPYVASTPDAGPPTPCQAACDTLARLGCHPQDTCVTVWAHIESARELRAPCGATLTCPSVTCTDVASAQRVSDLSRLGVKCE